MDSRRIIESLLKYFRFLLVLLMLFLVSCITIEVPSGVDSNSEPTKPSSVRKMEALGYSFTYHPENDTYWESRNSTEGWAFRIFDDSTFGMSGQFDKDYDSQTEASIDFFESLGVTPNQARLTVELTVEAMDRSDGEASKCDKGLCCIAQVVKSQQIYLWYCER